MITYLEKLWNKLETNNKNGDDDKKSYTLQSKFNKKNLAVMALVGVLLIVIAMPTSSSSSIDDTQGQQNTYTTSHTEVLDETYKNRMETELEGILAFVEGVGKVDAMITLAASSQKVVEKDKSTSDLDWEEHTIYGEDSYGQNPYVNQEIYPEVAGVVVAAQGGDNPVVVKNITEAIQALFAVDTHKIKIMKMKIDS